MFFLPRTHVGRTFAAAFTTLLDTFQRTDSVRRRHHHNGNAFLHRADVRAGVRAGVLAKQGGAAQQRCAAEYHGDEHQNVSNSLSHASMSS